MLLPALVSISWQGKEVSDLAGNYGASFSLLFAGKASKWYRLTVLMGSPHVVRGITLLSWVGMNLPGLPSVARSGEGKCWFWGNFLDGLGGCQASCHCAAPPNQYTFFLSLSFSFYFLRQSLTLVVQAGVQWCNLSLLNSWDYMPMPACLANFDIFGRDRVLLCCPAQ